MSDRFISIEGITRRFKGADGLFMATFFVGGALGSAIGAWAYAQGGWLAASAIGLALPAAAFAYFLTEKR